MALENNSADVIRALAAVQGQIPFAASVMLNKTAEAIRKAEQKGMRSSFDRPTPYALNSLFVRPSTRTNLEAVVGFKDGGGHDTPARKFLAPEILGGSRNAKSFEAKFRAKFGVGNNAALVPGRAVSKDRYGNIRKTLLIEAMSKVSRIRTPTVDERSYFTTGGSNIKAVYQRDGERVMRIFSVVAMPNYEKKFDYFDIAKDVFVSASPLAFEYALENAIRSAR